MLQAMLNEIGEYLFLEAIKLPSRNVLQNEPPYKEFERLLTSKGLEKHDAILGELNVRVQRYFPDVRINSPLVEV